MNTPALGITDVAGIEVGHHSDARRPTGCSVLIARGGATGGVDVRGAAPGTRETDLLDPAHTVDVVHAVLLAGGSAWGLDAAGGVMHWLDEQGIGLAVGLPGQPAGAGGVPRVPIVPAAVLFDLHLGDARIRPDAAAGYAACVTASRAAPAQGGVGAGSGASVGKLFGMARAMKGGIGHAALRWGAVHVGALVAVNALGDVIDPGSGRPIAGARSADGLHLLDSQRALLAGEAPLSPLAGSNTTIGVIATDAALTKAQARRIASAGHDGLARAIRPAHLASDGDTLFALGTALAPGPAPALDVLCALAAEAVAQACLNAVRAARGLRVGELWLPAPADLAPAPGA